MSSKTTTLKTIHNPRNQKTSKRFPNAKNVTRLDFLREAKRTKSLNKRKKSRKKKTYDQKKASSLKKEIQCRDISETTHNPQNYLFLNIPHCYLEEYAFHHGHPGYGIKWFTENNFRNVIKRCVKNNIYIYGIEAVDENGALDVLQENESYCPVKRSCQLISAFEDFVKEAINQRIRIVRYSATYNL